MTQVKERKALEANISKSSRHWREGAVFRPWLFAWLGGSVLGVVNGTARELLYKEQVGERGAQYISTASLIALLAVYMWVLQRRWPIGSRRTALQIGAMWVALTILFEFGFGHYVDRKSWSELLQNYNVFDGRVWIIVPLLMAFGPEIVRRIGGTRKDA